MSMKAKGGERFEKNECVLKAQVVKMKTDLCRVSTVLGQSWWKTRADVRNELFREVHLSRNPSVSRQVSFCEGLLTTSRGGGEAGQCTSSRINVRLLKSYWWLRPEQFQWRMAGSSRDKNVETLHVAESSRTPGRRQYLWKGIWLTGIFFVICLLRWEKLTQV